MTLHEPATLITDYLLGLLAAWCAWRLGRGANPPQISWSWALWLTAGAAWIGGTYHGFGPSLIRPVSAPLWLATLLLVITTSAAMGLTLVRELVPEAQRHGWRLLVASKFACFALVAFVYPRFVVAVADYGLVMVALGAAAAFTHRPWRGPMGAAVILSGLAAAAQQLQWGVTSWFNHNDLYHLIQAGAVWFFYVAGKRLGRTAAQTEPPLVRREKGAGFQWGNRKRNPTRQLSLQPVAVGAWAEETPGLRSPRRKRSLKKEISERIGRNEK